MKLWFDKKSQFDTLSIKLPKSVKTKYKIVWSQQEANFIKSINNFLNRKKYSSHFLITNDKIYKQYSSFIQQHFLGVEVIIIKDGESHKKLSTIEHICIQLNEKGVDRKTCLWAFGGGVIGDITGFVAAIYMRGVSFVQVPTTLLAMVDSSVGGKTGVNLASGKNMVGSFYQPQKVFMHIPLLETLGKKEVLCGLAEVVKSAIIYDKEFFQYLENNLVAIQNRDQDTFKYLSYSSAKIKASVVEQDEKEGGLRAILNFGHTLAHAVENYFNYKKITHGEAVAFGMAFATFFSAKKNFISQEIYTRIINLIEKLELPANIDQLPEKNLKKKKAFLKHCLVAMAKDKKNLNGQVRFILIHDIGEAMLPVAIPQIELEAALSEFFIDI